MLNIKNSDPYCFLWSIVAAFYPCSNTKKSSRVSSYPHFSSVLKYDGIEFPIKLKDISKFEILNSICVNVFGIEWKKKKCEIVPICLSNFEYLKSVNLLIIPTKIKPNFDENDQLMSSNINDYKPIYHFALIKDLSRLLCRQMGNLKSKKYFCDRCLNHFFSEEILNRHIFICSKMNKSKISVPSEDENLYHFLSLKIKKNLRLLYMQI